MKSARSTRRRVEMSRLLALTATLGVMLTASTGRGEGFDLQQFNPMPNLHESLFSTASGGVAGHLNWSAMVLYNHADDPLVVRDADDKRIDSVVSTQGTLHLLLSLGLLDWAEIGVDVPMVVWQEGSAFPQGARLSGDGSFGLGDIRLIPKVQLFTTRAHALDNGLALALLVNLHLPTGDADALQGGDFRVGPRLAFDWRIGGPRVAANVEYLYRSGKKIDNLNIDDTFGWFVAGEVPVYDGIDVLGEVRGRFTLTSDGLNAADSPTEFLLGAKATFGLLQLMAGGGAGLVGGYGAPEWRAVLGVGIGTPRTVPEAAPVVLAECTEESVAADCQALPASYCDAGVLRIFGAACHEGSCVYPAEEIACGAGMMCGEVDAQPACVPEPECLADADCAAAPASYCQDDAIASSRGTCLSGSCHYEVRAAPCGEGQRCSVEEGQATCVAVAVVGIVGQRIELRETVFFNTGSADIDARSHGLLNQVADLMQANPSIRLIRIEGHTDTSGSRNLNLRLSKERAAAVRLYLIDRGVDAQRMVAEGYGPDKPVQDNDSDAGRAANRRVEIHIVQQD